MTDQHRLSSSSSSANARQASVDLPDRSARVQLKRELAGLSYAEQVDAVRPRAPVQLLGGSALASSDVHSVAGQGISGSGGELPHLGAIQHSFGHHDVSGVRSHSGGAAQTATKALGAEAYATGDQVAFKKAPDLHTVAHEAAHVVQQRAGVSLPGGVGSVGDRYERQADAVADRVVSGKSATDLLDGFASGSGRAVQKVEVPGTGRKPTSNADYMAVPDFTTFAARCQTHLGWDQAKALAKWKVAIDGLDVAQDKWDALGGNWGAMTAWIDSAGRKPFETLGKDMLPDLDANAQYALWSGGDPAQQYATASGATILERTAVGEIFNKLDIAGESKWGINQAIWRGLSNSYAQKLAVCKLPIKVFQRKIGDIFTDIELPALVKERSDLGKAAPSLDYIALTMPDRFGNDSKRDGAQSNEAWQIKMTDLLGVTEAKKRFKNLYKYPKGSDLTGTSKGNNPAAAKTAIDANNAAVDTHYQTEFDKLKTVNINSDGVDKLTALKGVASALAAAIITERGRSPFTKPEDLAKVRGIASKVLADNAGRITV